MMRIPRQARVHNVNKQVVPLHARGRQANRSRHQEGLHFPLACDHLLRVACSNNKPGLANLCLLGCVALSSNNSVVPQPQ